MLVEMEKGLKRIFCIISEIIYFVPRKVVVKIQRDHFYEVLTPASVSESSLSLLHSSVLSIFCLLLIC